MSTSMLLVAAKRAAVATLFAGCRGMQIRSATPVSAQAVLAPRPMSVRLQAPAARAMPVYLDPGSLLSKDRSVYFGFDDDRIKRRYVGVVVQAGKHLASVPMVSIKAEGHADERGSAEYDLALGQRRAEALVRSLTIYGVKEARMEPVSGGEGRPKAQRHDDAAGPRNGRVDPVCPEHQRQARHAGCQQVVDSLTEGDVCPCLVGIERGDELAQIGIQPRQRLCIQGGQRLWQYARVGAGGVSDHAIAGRQDTQLHGAPVRAFAYRGDQLPFHQRPDQVAGCRLVNIHCTRQLIDTDARSRLDDVQRPQLGTADAGLLLDLLEVGLDGVEHHTKAAQNARRRLDEVGLRGVTDGLHLAAWCGSLWHPAMIETEVRACSSRHGLAARGDERSDEMLDEH